MANHQSAIKRIRQNEKKRLHNRYYKKTLRNSLKKIRDTKEKETAGEMFKKLTVMLDKMAQKKVIHKNKSANLKSKLAKHVKSL